MKFKAPKQKVFRDSPEIVYLYEEKNLLFTAKVLTPGLSWRVCSSAWEVNWMTYEIDFVRVKETTEFDMRGGLVCLGPL